MFKTHSFMYNKKFIKEPTEKQKVGQIGEDCACKYLQKLGYIVTDRNYLKKWGEIDIVVTKHKKIHFVEVKSISRSLESVNKKVIHETSDQYRVEDNLHPWKLKRLGRTIQSYLLEKDISDKVEWQFDVMTIHIDMDKRLSRVFVLEDIIL